MPELEPGRLWALSGIRMTIYSGARGTLYGPWATSKTVDTRNGGPPGRLVMSPPPLWNYGANFGVYLRPTT